MSTLTGNKKFKLLLDDTIEVSGIKLFRIRARIAFGSVAAGELGGYVERTGNIAESGNAWVSDNAWVYGNARVSDNAWVYGNARVSDNARVYGNARVSDNARVCGDARVYGDAALFWASKVGSENGTLTVFKAKSGVEVTRGCFHGTVEAFLTRVAEVHGNSKIGREYRLLIEVALSRLGVEISA